MKTQTEIFADNLKMILIEKDISQNELSRKLDVSPASVNAWCQGTSMPRSKTLERICQYLNISNQELMLDKANAPNLSIPAAYPLPILGAICAGDGILASQNFDGYFFVDNSIRADYCLRIEGDSMNDANIFHGDIAFIKKSYGFLDGRIYAVIFGENENAVLKKIYKQDDGLLLTPCNQNYKPIFVKDAIIVGECVGIYHTI